MCDELKIGLGERNFEKKLFQKPITEIEILLIGTGMNLKIKNEKDFSPNFPSNRFLSLWSSQTLTASVGVKELGRPLFKNAT